MKPISKKDIDKILRESSVNPREPGPIKVVADMVDPDFLRKYTIKLLNEASYGETDSKIKLAITYLAMARYFIAGKGVVQKLGPVERFKNPDTKK